MGHCGLKLPVGRVDDPGSSELVHDPLRRRELLSRIALFLEEFAGDPEGFIELPPVLLILQLLLEYLANLANVVLSEMPFSLFNALDNPSEEANRLEVLQLGVAAVAFFPILPLPIRREPEDRPP